MEGSSREGESEFLGASLQGSIDRVREGMKVIDSAGEEIGKVEIVKMGDPGAATIGADADTDGGLFQNFAEAFGFEPEPEVPAALRARMLRLGFIKVDAKGLFAGSRYITADKIANVATDTVTLNIRKDQMVEED